MVLKSLAGLELPGFGVTRDLWKKRDAVHLSLVFSKAGHKPQNSGSSDEQKRAGIPRSCVFQMQAASCDAGTSRSSLHVVPRA